jgi:hypothetical protein
MPTHYHVHTNKIQNDVINNFIKDKPLFFSRMNSWYYETYKSAWKESIIYKIYIPLSRYTTSFNPRCKNKIVRVTLQNVDEYKYIRKKYKGHSNFIKEMNKRGIIGIDSTDIKLNRYPTLRPLEGYFWSKPNDIIIKKIN